jgi:hypothetical protein
LYIAWVCEISKDEGETKAKVLQEYGIDARVSHHDESFCVEIKEEDVEKASKPELMKLLFAEKSD